MGKFQIAFTEEIWKVIAIEADSAEDAEEKFWTADWYDYDAVAYDGCIQEGIEVTEVSEDGE